jgi:putative flippase GtrA
VRRPHIQQFLRYGFSAGGVAVLYVFVYWAGLQFGLHYFLAILIAQVVAIAVAFPVYRSFVFESRGSLTSDFLRFLSVWVGGAIAGIVATPVLVEIFGVDPFWAQVAAILVISVASFLSHRFFTFRRREAPARPVSSRGAK